MELQRAPTLAEQVARLLRDEISAGHIQPGERIPTEQQLSVRFDVSRAVIREAVSRLKHDGLVDSHRGRGAFVSWPARTRAFRIDSVTPGDRGELSQIFELRMTVEVGAAGLAANRRKKAHLAEMQAALAAMEQSVQGASDGVEADARFHKAIAEATGNTYFREFMQFLQARVHASIRAARYDLLQDPRRARIDIAEHRAIYDAIAAGDPANARQAIMRHLSNAAKDLKLEKRIITDGAVTNRAAPRR